MDWGEVITGSVGVVVGAVLTALIAPITPGLERLSRRATRAKPLFVHIETDPSVIWAGFPDWIPLSHFFETPPPIDGPVINRADWLAWASRHGGVDAALTTVHVTLQAQGPATVAVQGLRVRRRSSSVAGGQIVTRGVGGASVIPRKLTIHLDSGVEPIVTSEDNGGDTSIGFPNLQLATGDTEVLHIWAEAESGRHEWTAYLILLVEGRRVLHPIRNNGKPFVTVGASGIEQRVNYAATDTWTEPEVL